MQNFKLLHMLVLRGTDPSLSNLFVKYGKYGFRNTNMRFRDVSKSYQPKSVDRKVKG